MNSVGNSGNRRVEPTPAPKHLGGSLISHRILRRIDCFALPQIGSGFDRPPIFARRRLPKTGGVDSRRLVNNFLRADN
jgi:hypothetical protein